ncbi:hypothetical protein ACFL4E_03020 [Candidatus Omnitrophota bacterium]
MRKIIYITIILTICYSFSLNGAYALFDTEKPWLPEKEEWMPTFSHSQSFLSKYIWRGWNLGDEPVWQMDTAIFWYGFTFDFWTNYSLNNNKERDGGRYQEFTEIDYTFDYTFNIGEMSDLLDYDSPDLLDPLSISAGYIYYTFPNLDWDDKFFDTHEIYFGASYDCLLQPSFTWYWDVGRGKGNSDGGGNGSYFLFGIGHSFDLGDSGITANVGMTTGINNEQWTDKTGWADMVFSGDLEIPVFNYFTITPSMAFSLILDRDTYNDASENEFYGGITISFEY